MGVYFTVILFYFFFKVWVMLTHHSGEYRPGQTMLLEPSISQAADPVIRKTMGTSHQHIPPATTAPSESSFLIQFETFSLTTTSAFPVTGQSSSGHI